MQTRMKNYQLTSQQIEKILHVEKVGRIGTISSNGNPYIVPVHYVLYDNKIYIHGLSKGQKVDNIQRNGNICFEIDCMHNLIMNEKPCAVNTAYQSVVIMGYARFVYNDSLKITILNKIIDKYTPSLSGKELSPKSVIKTSIIEIEIKSCTGKYYG